MMAPRAPNGLGGPVVVYRVVWRSISASSSPHHDGPSSEKHEDDCGNGERQRHEIELDQSAFFILVMNDVQGVEQGFSPGIRRS
jgi:hypothetical protein